MGAQITAGEYDRPGAVTLIDEDGAVAVAEEFDRTAVLPQGFHH